MSAPEPGPIGVLLMAYGGPDSLGDVPGYLADIRTGRPTPRAVVEEITDHYRQIGGRSPLLAMSRRQLEALSVRLDPTVYRCYLGMRHWSPWIEEVIGAMADEGIRQAVGIVLAPHNNRWNNGRYRDKIETGRELFRANIDFTMVESYHDSPPLIDALARRVRQGLAHWSSERAVDAHIVFCAHSLPVRVAGPGDPYQPQLLQTAGLVAAAAGLPAERWSWSWVSAGRSPEPWLGPGLLESLGALAAQGVRRVVCVPVGFVTEHVDILYDIDIEARARAAELGMELVRPPALNDDPLFIDALAGAVRAAAARFGPAEGRATDGQAPGATAQPAPAGVQP
jgi:ferrochelatase